MGVRTALGYPTTRGPEPEGSQTLPLPRDASGQKSGGSVNSDGGKNGLSFLTLGFPPIVNTDNKNRGALAVLGILSERERKYFHNLLIAAAPQISSMLTVASLDLIVGYNNKVPTTVTFVF